MADVFGYSNTVQMSGQLASTDFASVSIGGGANALVQSVEANYGHRIDEVTQVGSPQVFWLPGRPSGNLDVTRLVGAGGFFAGWIGGTCGKVSGMGINVAGGKCGFSGGGSVTFSGGMVERLTVSMNTGQQTIAAGVSIKVASMS